jgi:protein TonB
MIELSPSDFAATDIGRIRGTAPARGEADAGTASTGRAVAGPSLAPGGKTLYAADWYREPSRAEIAPYMPAGASQGWGMIACRTVERFHVEDCRVIGETPGSRIGQGLRQAAWQFLVIPPRENGRPMLGTWVRIRFDLVRGVEP